MGRKAGEKSFSTVKTATTIQDSGLVIDWLTWLLKKCNQGDSMLEVLAFAVSAPPKQRELSVAQL